MNALDQYFGLGEGGTPTRLAVFWPSGRVQVIDSPAKGQVLTVEEPAS